jgi:hypothetical protein
MINVIESRPLGHDRDVTCDGCADCTLLAKLESLSFMIFDWEVVGEGVVRGQMFQADLWRYVRIGDHLSYLDVTAEFLYKAGAEGHRHALYRLVTGQTLGVLR